MTHYYDQYLFTENQADHAIGVVSKLMKERRFFLYRHNGHSFGGDPDYVLNPEVFADAIQLDEEVRDAYREAKLSAETSISKAESKLGVKKPNLSGNKQVVRCSRYTGGFDICRVYPVTAFTALTPKSFEDLTEIRFKQLMGNRNEDDLSPKAIREHRERAAELSETIWGQLEAIEAQDPNNHRCLVMMYSRCKLSWHDKNNDFAERCVWDIQKHPHAVGYLFHAYCMQTRIVRHSHIVSSTSRASHVNIRHWSDSSPTINYEASAGYDCSAAFVTIL